ncbi:MAG: hypothetical protein M3P43_12775 [Actinomycetota bacterium]|nr:hypothetical protein [Actinomycetota bacterium]
MAAALQELNPEGEVEVDPVYLSVATDLPRSWRSFGEHVVTTVDASDGGSVFEVSSRGVHWQLIDYGKNRRNVEAVVDRLTRGG